MMQLEARDRRALILGAVAVTALLLYLLWPSPSAEQGGVELVAAEERSGAEALGGTDAPMQVQPPAQVFVPPPPAQTAAAPATSVAVPQGLRLYGVTGRGAIFGFGDGGQIYVERGREVADGLTLQGVSVRHVVLATPTGAFRLGFGGGAVPIQAAGRPPAAAAAGQGNAAAAAQAYRAALAPHEVNGRTIGYVVRPDASLPLLRQAGLQPGDVIVKVNGDAFDSGERLSELPDTIADSRTTEFEIKRGGRRMTLSLRGARR